MQDPDTRLEKPQRRQELSVWLLAVILVIVALSIFGAMAGTGSMRHTGAKQIKVSDTDLDENSVADMTSVTLETKAAFISSIVDGKPDKRHLKEALTSAQLLVEDTHNAPLAARCLIIVRALTGNSPLAKTSKGTSPLDAFDVNLPSGITAADRANYVRESKLWTAAFGPAKLTAAQASKIVSDIRHLPHLKWWRHPAIYAVYVRAGDVASAKNAASDAANSCLFSVASAGAMMFLKLISILIGMALLIAMAVMAYARRQRPAVDVAAYSPYGPPIAAPDYGTPAPGGEDAQAGLPDAPAAPMPHLGVYGQPGTSAIPGMPGTGDQTLWKVEPEPVAVADRRLTSADLFGVFLLYLFLSAALGLVVSGFPGFGHAHVLKFNGLISPFLHKISLMPSSTRMIIVVSLETVLYVAGGIVPIFWLRHLARKRGASLGKELGMTRRLSLKSILYGIGGYCIGMPLMIVVALVAPKVFRHFPSPSNPAIPQLISANTLTAGFLLIALASIAAPIVEETLFRGVLYNAIKMRTGAWPAIILSGIIFGFIHPVGIAEMFPLAVLGSVFAWMAETRKSLAPSMVAHCINNLTSCLLVFALMQQ